MEKISLKNISSFGLVPLSRAQLKKVTGGFSSAAGNCTGPLGGCDLQANCTRGSGGAGKCDLRNSVCACF